MANTIQLKRKTTTGAPGLGDLSVGECCLVIPDETLYWKKDAGTIVGPLGVAGVGDMLAATYDPNTVNGDAFDMDNMVEGTAKILTTAERAEIAANTLKTGVTTEEANAAVANVGEIDTGTDNVKTISALGLAGSQLQTDVTTNNAKPNAASITAEIGAAIDALVGGAPGALDTLNELAAAMADDAAFSATMTAALATKLDANSTIDGGTV